MSIHAAFVVALIFVVVHPPPEKRKAHTGVASIPALEFTPEWMRAHDADVAGKLGSSGDHNPLLPTAGELAPPSRLNLAPPRPIAGWTPASAASIGHRVCGRRSGIDKADKRSRLAVDAGEKCVSRNGQERNRQR